ncbi:MAG: hypothetical protein ABI205_03125, partial [Gemmatimonadaceae bacterium]
EHHVHKAQLDSRRASTSRRIVALPTLTTLSASATKPAASALRTGSQWENGDCDYQYCDYGLSHFMRRFTG